MRPQSDPLYVDLTLGGWRPRQAAAELADQLGLSLNGIDSARNGYVISRGVDREARGNSVVLAGFDDAERVIPRIGARPVLVAPPRYDQSWRQENEWFLTFLSRNGADLRVIGNDPSPFQSATDDPRSWPLVIPPEANRSGLTDTMLRLLRFFPGLVPTQFLRHHGIDAGTTGLLPAGTGYFVPPSLRDRDPRTAADDMDMLSVLESYDDGVLAVTQAYGSNLYVRALDLANLAQACHAAGSSELAVALLVRARENARSVHDTAIVDLHLQGIRIFQHQFHAAALNPDPGPGLPPDLHNRLKQMKDWGAIMIGQSTDADRHLGAMLEQLDTSAAPEDLYLLNVYALSEFHNDRPARAMEIERRIEACLAEAKVRDHRLAFVNSINIARLLRTEGDWSGYEAYLEKAFATSIGTRSLGEMLQYNLMRAVSARRNDPALAAIFELRSAFIWLAIEPPEGIGPRVVRAMLGRRELSPGDADRVVSSELLARLETCWPNVAHEDIPVDAEVMWIDARHAPIPNEAWAIPGLALLKRSAPSSPRRRSYHSEERMRLARKAISVFFHLSGVSGDPRIWLVDDQLGRDLPTSQADALGMALRHGVPEVRLSGQAIRIDADTIRLVARLAPAVDSVTFGKDAATVSFKRHFDDFRVEGPDLPMLRTVCDAGASGISTVALEEIASLNSDTALPALRRLERARILHVDVCDAA